MVAVNARYDDVLLALRGKRQLATKRVKHTFPGALFPEGKARRMEFDVSDEGERELEKFVANQKKELLKLGKQVDKLSNAKAEAKESTKIGKAKPLGGTKPASKPASQEPGNTDHQQDQTEGSSGPQDTAEATGQ